MTHLALLVLLSSAPDAGLPAWTKTESPPEHFALFSTKPVPDENRFGKVLPAFASARAFVKSKHPLLERFRADQLKTLSRALDTSKEQVSIGFKASPVVDAELPLPFLSMSGATLTAMKQARSTRVLKEGCCDDDAKLEDIGVHKVKPASVWRDDEKRVRALAIPSEEHTSVDPHGDGKVTERNATEHRWTLELFEFDELGRVTTFVKLSRADNEMRYLPYISIEAYTLAWSETRLETVTGFKAIDDPGDAFDLVSNELRWTRAP